MFKPTKEELEELWFKNFWEWFYIQKNEEESAITYSDWSFHVFPDSIEDIKTLIRILIPQ